MVLRLQNNRNPATGKYFIEVLWFSTLISSTYYPFFSMHRILFLFCSRTYYLNFSVKIQFLNIYTHFIISFMFIYPTFFNHQHQESIHPMREGSRLTIPVSAIRQLSIGTILLFNSHISIRISPWTYMPDMFTKSTYFDPIRWRVQSARVHRQKRTVHIVFVPVGVVAICEFGLLQLSTETKVCFSMPLCCPCVCVCVRVFNYEYCLFVLCTLYLCSVHAFVESCSYHLFRFYGMHIYVEFNMINVYSKSFSGLKFQ